MAQTPEDREGVADRAPWRTTKVASAADIARKDWGTPTEGVRLGVARQNRAGRDEQRHC